MVVCSDTPLALRVVIELTTRYAAKVTVVLPSREQGHGPRLAELPGVDLVEARRIDSTTYERAGLASAAALALLAQGDAPWARVLRRTCDFPGAPCWSLDATRSAPRMSFVDLR